MTMGWSYPSNHFTWNWHKNPQILEVHPFSHFAIHNFELEISVPDTDFECDAFSSGLYILLLWTRFDFDKLQCGTFSWNGEVWKPLWYTIACLLSRLTNTKCYAVIDQFPGMEKISAAIYQTLKLKNHWMPEIVTFNIQRIFEHPVDLWIVFLF